ncbi:MAG: tRNA (adenosine(37)-N6)-threonylcarbamoyltransferase complex dimerization subunit type 1 TsaB [Candidatus Marinimicrobia bacterium]|nr:tRNA (adenosine(37)-N6)-threonylcarbamoyltransferase complex dimerization subunit type 1 TsaB [Candidatus Neomarinimicrobiota bacterium]
MIIACDTSSVVCSVAVSHHGQILEKWSDSGSQIHIEKLSPFLEQALRLCHSRTEGIDALALAIGPGSFNGLRIGLANMKALALSLNLPLIPISTIDAMARGLGADVKRYGRGVVFSHRNYVHFADYDLKNWDPSKEREYFYGPWGDLLDSKIDFYFGTIDRGLAEWLKGEGKPLAERFLNVKADASTVALLAESRLAKEIPDLDQLEPFYNAIYEAKKWVPPQF